MKPIQVEINYTSKKDCKQSDFDIGGVYLKCEGRSYIWDVVDYEVHADKVICKLARDDEVFGAHTKYDITEADLMNPKLKGTISVESDDCTIGAMTLTVELMSLDAMYINNGDIMEVCLTED